MELAPELAPETPAQKEEKENPSRISQFLLFAGIEDRRAKTALFFVLVTVFISALLSFLVMPPFGFPGGKTITIKKGASLTEVSSLLDKENLIRSVSAFEFCAKVVGGEKPISAGQYLFKEPISACVMAFRIAHSISNIPAIKVTIPEGMSNREITEVLKKNIPDLDSEFFLEHVRSQEGFLFPDTYFFPENINAKGVEAIMTANFNKKTETMGPAIEASGHSLRDIITMASLLETEATLEEDKSLVSGVLWNRIAKKMPLQVDATFMYLIGKKSSDLTMGDLQMKSTYNTYQNLGLPAGPIGNPGLIAIRAALYPARTEYLYYLSDSDGVMHYAKTFEEHKLNKIKYIR